MGEAFASTGPSAKGSWEGLGFGNRRRRFPAGLSRFLQTRGCVKQKSLQRPPTIRFTESVCIKDWRILSKFFTVLRWRWKIWHFSTFLLFGIFQLSTFLISTFFISTFLLSTIFFSTFYISAFFVSTFWWRGFYCKESHQLPIRDQTRTMVRLLFGRCLH